MSHDLDEDVFKQEEIPGFSHDEIQDERSLEPVAFVIFGGAGDLSKRKLLPALYELFKSGSTPKVFSVIGFGIPVMTRAAYQTFTRQALKDFSAKTYDEAVCEQFLEHLYYVSGEFSDIAQYDQMLTLVEDLIPENKGGLIPVVFYLATPPTVLDFIIDGFAHVLPEHSRLDCKVVVEKPFGVDRPSAVALNKKFRRVFEENKIYRMDHYLGKETVQNILFFRFGNSMFEPLWSRRYIDHVQITVAEDIGIENRGGFYEKAGVVRDIIQNHMMQLIALIAMEPPTSFSDADYVRNEKIKIYKSIRPMDDEYIDTFTARGQYARGRNEQSGKKGYREENYVAKDSIAPTFIAAKIYIDTWRWSGVPFYIRAGKRLKKQVTEIYVQFKQPPLKLFGDGFGGMVPNGLVFSIQPEEEITMHFSVKQPGVGNTPHPVKMVFSYKDSFKTSPLSAYERLLLDCLKGDLTLFPRQDGIESMWEVVDTIIKRWEANPPTCFPNYFAGTWGPPKAFDLMTSEGRQWRFSEERSSEKIYKLGDLQEISDVAAKKFGELYQPGKRLNIALSGGRTPRLFLEKLSTVSGVNWEKVDIFIVDERFLPLNDIDSNFLLINDNFLSRIRIPKENVHYIPYGDDLETSRRQYEMRIQQHFGLAKGAIPEFDLIVLGIGLDGTTASLFPETCHSDTHELVTASAGVNGEPYGRITLTLPVLNHAKNLFFLASGAEKAEVVEKVLGKHDTSLSAVKASGSVKNVYYFLDSNASRLLYSRNGEDV